MHEVVVSEQTIAGCAGIDEEMFKLYVRCIILIHRPIRDDVTPDLFTHSDQERSVPFVTEQALGVLAAYYSWQRYNVTQSNDG